MDSASLSALAALAGATIGGLTSFASSWLTQGAQARIQELVRLRTERETLYRRFIEEASPLFVDAVMHDKIDIPRLVSLYALIGDMRLISTPAVLRVAEEIASTIVDTYSRPNKSFDQLREMLNDASMDPLKIFSETCRAELMDEGRMAATLGGGGSLLRGFVRSP